MHYRIGGSVGKVGSNSAKDVKLVQALLNVYLRREGKKALTITGKPDPDTLSAIDTFQKTEQKLLKPDGHIDVNGQTFKSLKKGVGWRLEGQPTAHQACGRSGDL